MLRVLVLPQYNISTVAPERVAAMMLWLTETGCHCIQTKQSWREQTEMFPPLQSPLNTRWESCWHVCDCHGSQTSRARTEVRGGLGQRRTAGGNASRAEYDRWRSEHRANKEGEEEVSRRHDAVSEDCTAREGEDEPVQVTQDSIQRVLQGFTVHSDIRCLWHLTLIDLFFVQQCKETRQSCNFRDSWADGIFIFL